MAFLKAGQDRVQSHFGIEFLLDMKNLVKCWKNYCSIPPLHKHIASSNSSLTSKDMEGWLRIPLDIVKLTLKMLAEKKSRKSELMNIIQEVLRQNDKKLKELLANEENGTTLWTNLPKAPEGYKFEGLLYRTPEGALLKIKNETELLDL